MWTKELKNWVNVFGKNESENFAGTGSHAFPTSGSFSTLPGKTLKGRIKLWKVKWEEALTGKWSERKANELHRLSTEIIRYGIDSYDEDDIHTFYQRYSKLESYIKQFKIIFEIEVRNMSFTEIDYLENGIGDIKFSASA